MKNKNELVRVNKQINLNKVDIEEGFQNLYVNILQRINQMEKYENIDMSKSDLINFFGINTRNTEYLHNIFLRLTSSNKFEIGNKEIYGSVFSVRYEKEKENYKIYVNEPFRDLLFTKTDINLMTKVKKYKHLPLSTEEQEYWNKTLKEKKQFLMLLNNSSIRNLRGKNDKTIYSMLREFLGSKVISGEFKGQCYRKISYKDFKEALNLNETYRNNNVDLLLKKAKANITEKTEITISEIKKYPEKVGRGAKREYMVIYFYEKEKLKEKDDDIIEIVSDEGASEKKIKVVEDEKVTKLKELIKKQTKNLPNHYEIRAKILSIKDYDKLLDFIRENNLLINYELVEN